MDNLNRFIEAQENTYDTALEEIKNGCKVTHWMWFIFPQIVGLGSSEISDYYAIKSLDEANEYLKHPILGNRLIEVSSELLSLEGRDATSIFGSIDALKLKSSMTLFYEVSGNQVFASVLDKFYKGMEDEKTIEIINNLKCNGSKKKLSLLDRLKSLC